MGGQGKDASFGVLLRAEREAAGLSQQELAERAGLTVNGISQLERGLRTRPYPHTVRALAEALGLDADARARLRGAVPARGRHRVAPTSLDPDLVPVALPAHPGAPIGRSDEVAAVRRTLEAVRLLTLTGPGGVGKTTLAVAAASGVTRREVVFAALADVTDAEAALLGIAGALGVRATGLDVAAQLHAALALRAPLLVLDNVEQIDGFGVRLAALLGACPQVTVLATSRAPLHIRAEHVRAVQPLALSPGGAQHAQSPAVRLLVDRARAYDPTFDPAAAAPGVLAAICRRLDGLPLAIELAAAWLRILPPAELLRQLDGTLAALADGPADLPARHRTLRDAVAWSERLLSQEHRDLLHLLAVLPGSWDLDLAAAVADGSPSALLPAVAVLVDHHLVERAAPDEDGRVRFTMLQTIRAFALEELVNEARDELARRRHAAFVAGLVARAGPGLDGPEQARWLHRLEERMDHVRAALRWLLDNGEREAACQLYGQLFWFWYLRHCSEGLRWGAEVLSTVEARPSAGRGRARAAAALVKLGSGDLAGACDEAAAAATDGEAAGDDYGLGLALTVHANAAAGTDAHARVLELTERARRHAARIEDRRVRALVLAVAALAQARSTALRGDASASRRLLEEAEVHAQAAGQPWVEAFWLNMAVTVDQLEGRWGEVPDRLRRAFALCRELDDTPALLYTLAGTVTQLVGEGRHRDASRLAGAIEALAEHTGQRVTDAVIVARLDADRQAIAGALDEAAAAEELAAGKAAELDALMHELGYAT